MCDLAIRVPPSSPNLSFSPGNVALGSWPWLARFDLCIETPGTAGAGAKLQSQMPLQRGPLPAAITLVSPAPPPLG